MQGLINMMKELHDLAGQHDHIAESMSKLVLKDLQTAIQELKQERKRVTGNLIFLCSRSAYFMLLLSPLPSLPTQFSDSV